MPSHRKRKASESDTSPTKKQKNLELKAVSTPLPESKESESEPSPSVIITEEHETSTSRIIPSPLAPPAERDPTSPSLSSPTKCEVAITENRNYSTVEFQGIPWNLNTYEVTLQNRTRSVEYFKLEYQLGADMKTIPFQLNAKMFSHPVKQFTEVSGGSGHDFLTIKFRKIAKAVGAKKK